eukprot:scaffold43044_cov52-Phaeocystis_antarctica.AAC.2
MGRRAAARARAARRPRGPRPTGPVARPEQPQTSRSQVQRMALALPSMIRTRPCSSCGRRTGAEMAKFGRDTSIIERAVRHTRSVQFHAHQPRDDPINEPRAELAQFGCQTQASSCRTRAYGVPTGRVLRPELAAHCQPGERRPLDPRTHGHRSPSPISPSRPTTRPFPPSCPSPPPPLTANQGWLLEDLAMPQPTVNLYYAVTFMPC